MLCAFVPKAALLSIQPVTYLQIQKKIAPLHLAKPDKSLAEKRAEREKELLEIGGDPFFLTDDDLLEDTRIEEDDDGTTMSSLSLLALSGVGNGITDIAEGGALTQQDDAQSEDDFEWNGEVDESAYFDYN
jgi:hypothetical protein